MKAIIIYDDPSFADRVGTVLRRVGSRAEVNVDWLVGFWSASALSDASCADKALATARDAHLIVLPARLAQSIPVQLLDWLERWVRRRRIVGAAVGIVDLGETAEKERPLHPDLLQFVRKHGLALIGKGAPHPDTPAKPLVHSREEHRLALPVSRPDLYNPIRQEGYRSYGINE